MVHTLLRSFHAVARKGGFTAAARSLGIGQPTVTMQVRALERRYGVDLFHRGGRGVALTDAGEGLFRITQRLFDSEADAVAHLNALRQLHVGRLKVGAVGPNHATSMLAAFHERYPGIEITVRISNSDTLVADLLAYRTDVAILARVALASDISLEQRMEDDARFYSITGSPQPVVVIVPADHPWAGRRSVRIEEFAGERVVLREVGSTTRAAFEQALRNAGVRPEVVMEVGGREGVWGAVRHGIGVSLAPLAEFIPHPRIRTLALADVGLHTVPCVACLAERRDNRLIAAFMATIRPLLQPCAAPAQPRPAST